MSFTPDPPPPSAAPRTVSLLEILDDIEFRDYRGDLKIPVSALALDSRLVRPGSAFFALKSARPDAPGGASHIADAINRGAVAIISEEILKETCRPDPVWVRVADARRTLSAAALNFHAHPERSLRLAAVTGTNGKTTVTTLLHHLLGTDNSKWGLVGTVRYELGGRSIPAHRTTPEAHELAAMMAQMRDTGCEGLVMELSSHAIAQHRADGLPFAALAFTNLTQDHMDYHGDMKSYFQTKALPFLGKCGAAPPPFAVLNAADPAARNLAEILPKTTRPLFFGEEDHADFRAVDIRLGPAGTTFKLLWPGATAPVSVHTSLPGSYNVANILCALALAHALGRPPEALIPALATFPGVPGRMERVGDGWPCPIFVDYAHTDDALRNALRMLRAITPGRLLVVFGCGGNRDRAKRPKMTAAVQDLADFAWATSDNPRKEPQESIFEDMRTGVSAPEKIAFIEDRRHAISLALDGAREGDTLLIAGKGHEDYQEFSTVTIPFDDRLVTRELLSLKRLRPRQGIIA
ncbi:MAG: UDP-N-acetylmuramoyl-L-alanyl-D-glutamate--2,6-diaminopimelate ligase [Puniceicoccales bacterium]|nr:UDP-N-acetylmuramoyl-L-alanyl-D-glutamate--2,6-diaminopimelate ligase [Puniceicoccales bacterium]